MADVVTINGMGFKRRNPWGVVGLMIITVGIYGFVWYYKINNELKNYGIDNNPTKAVLAVSLGWLIIVPPFVSYYNTAERIRKAQEKAGASERIIPVLALVLLLVVSTFANVYYQSQLNKVWDMHASQEAEPAPATPTA